MKKIFTILSAVILAAVCVRGLKFDGRALMLSHAGGFYDTDIDLEIYAAPGTKYIYYTLDGSVPIPDPEITHTGIPATGTTNTEDTVPESADSTPNGTGSSGTLYCAPIHLTDPSPNPNRFDDYSDIADWFRDVAVDFPVDKANILRAAAYDAEGNLLEEIKATYFIGLDREKYDNITVLSLIADPEDLFGYERGIYTFGKSLEEMDEPDYVPRTRTVYSEEVPLIPANFLKTGREWERDCHAEFYFPGDEPDYAQDLGIRIKGGFSRHYAQKGLALFAREDYGKPYMTHDFWKGVSEGEIRERSLSLSAGGFSDRALILKDVLIYDLCRELDLIAPAWRPVIVFLNGEYWGFYQLAQRVDEEFFQYHYGVSKDNVALLKLYNRPEEQENRYLFDEVIDFVNENDITDPEIYARFQEMVDIQSLFDYYGVNIYIYNTDWPKKNVLVWRSYEKGLTQYEDCRWRYILGDMNIDNVLDAYLVEKDMIDKALENDPLFSRLYENREFRQGLKDNIIRLSETVFEPERAEELLMRYSGELQGHIEENMRRFPNYSVEDLYFEEEREIMNYFFILRPESMRDLMKEWW